MLIIPVINQKGGVGKTTVSINLAHAFARAGVRTLLVDASQGREVATAVWEYEHGDAGVILARDPNLARQHPADYVKGAEVTIRKALAEARRNVKGFNPDQVIGVDDDAHVEVVVH